jgi:outer membrane autotransporter protein
MSISFPRARSRRDAARILFTLGTALGCTMGVSSVASAQNIVRTGSGDYSLTRTDTISGGPRTVDISTTSGNITLDLARVQVDNQGPNPRPVVTPPILAGAGIAATNTGTGNVAITSGNVTATGPGQTYAIDARSTTGAITINSGTATSTTNGSIGILAQSSGGGAVTINSDVATGGQRGIFTGFAGGVTTINSNIATANGLTSPNAIVAQGGTVILNSTNASLTGNGSNGAAIFVQSGLGGARVTSGTATTQGFGQNAIQVFSQGSGSIDSGTVVTTGTFARGIYSNATDSNLVRSTSVTTSGDGATGIYVSPSPLVSNGPASGSITVNSGTIRTSGADAAGILVSPVTPTGQGNASILTGATAITSGTITTTGARSAGIAVTGTTAPVTIASTNVSTTGAAADGIVVSGTVGAVNIQTGTVTTQGADARGVFAQTTDGAITINGTGAVRTTGTNANAINAFAQTGAVNVTTGAVSTTGTGANAIVAQSGSGPATVTANGAISAPGASSAILVNGGTTATLNLGSGGSLNAAGRGVQITSVTGSTVNNAGSIAGDAVTPIISATGGALTFNNSGTFLVLPGTTTAGTVNLTGLESFNNSGTVDLRNGHAGDTLSVSGSFNGTGNSVLALDANLAPAGTASLADRLVAGGAITGQTLLQVNALGSGGAILNPGTIFATGGTGSSAGAFVLAPGSVDQGFIRYGLAFAPATNSYSLIGAPGDAVFRTLKVSEGAQQLWHKSADAIASHMSTTRNMATDEASGARIWGLMYGQVNRRETSQDASAFGQTRVADLTYKQDAFGGQMGFDFGGARSLTFGVTGGYLNSHLGFANSLDNVRYSVANAGVYASFYSGGLFANALAKYDHAWIDTNGVSAGYDEKLTGKSYGARGEIGFRLGSDSFHIEPVASIAYVRTNIETLKVLNANVDFDRLNGLRGKAGLRLGSDMTMGNGARMQVYAQGNYVHEFKGKGGIAFTSGGTTLGYSNIALGDYGEAKAGFSIASLGGVTGFIEGFGDYGKNYKGGGGRAGLRFGF